MGRDAWYQAGLRFECTQCGRCCGGAPGYVWLTREEIAKIAGFLGLELKTFVRQYVRRVGFKHSLIEKANLDCVFLRFVEGKSICAIYPVRPLQCRTWPFWQSNVQSSRAWQQACRMCPGSGQGPLVPQEIVKQLVAVVRV